MLFDLRGRGRRRTVQVIYATLAILLGGGLVLFGIGGDVQGGLFDAFTGGDGDADTDFQEDEAKKAREAVERNPRDARAWAVLAEKEYALSKVSDGLQRVVEGQTERLVFTGEARQRALAAERAWDRHLQLVGDPKKADPTVAPAMVGFFADFGKPDKALTAQVAYIESLGDRAGYGDYQKAARLAYAAEKVNIGDNYRRLALEDAPDKPTRDELKAILDPLKSQAEQAAAAKAQQANPPPVTTTP